MSLSYDASGRVCADETRGISSIEYDNDGHPVRIIFESGNEQRDIWDGLGNHLATEYYDTGSMEGKEPFVTKRYAGDGQIEYQIGPDIGIPNRIIAYTAFPGGYFDQDGAPHYYITDYQGYNTAIVDSLPKIIEENNCHSYGEPLREKRGMPFLFSGNERLLPDGLNEYDFHARRYNAAIPAFTSWDALNEQYPWLSPYAYAAANPINFIDPSGQRIIVWEDEVEWEYRVENGTGGLYNANGDKYSGDSMILESLEEIRTANELGHAYDYITPESFSQFAHTVSPVKSFIRNLHFNVDPYEAIPCIIENSIRSSLGEFIRKSYKAIKTANVSRIDYKSYLNYSSYDNLLLLHL